jgi:hypothetical protein
MTIQLSVTARNARLDAIETIVGVSGKLQMYTGSPPANCATAPSGTKIFEETLASDWAAAASAGTKSFNNTPISDVGLSPGGVAGYFRLTDNAGTTCHMQGTITATGGGGDMTVDNTSIATGQPVNITGFTMADNNA